MHREGGLLGKQHIDDNIAYQIYLEQQKAKKAKAEHGKTANMGEHEEAHVASSSRSRSRSSSEASAAAPAAGEWTSAEQATFEKALKAIGKEAKDRWVQIADQVKSKTADQCQARFKQIRDDIKKSQQQQQQLGKK